MFANRLFSRASQHYLRTSSATQLQQLRFLNLHEYQSQELMKEYGISVSPGKVASTPEEAYDAAKELGTSDLVIKAQVLAGGRGLGHFKENKFDSGVHMLETPDQVKDAAAQMLGNHLVTKQTGEEGKLCNKVLITERQYIEKEKYFAILLDRKTSGAMIVGSKTGGTDIENIAARDPDAIFKMPIKLTPELTREQSLSVANALNFPSNLTSSAADEIEKLYKLFVSTDALQVEVNPFVETVKGEVMSIDAKINFDDNAAFRQKELFAQRDYSQEDSREVAAAKYDLNFIGLDGSIGCLVNGAGLAMSTMDIINLHGGSPANFLDVGGGATEKQVTEALKIIASDSKVNAILINIFGGIMRCDVIARGIVAAVETLNLEIPLVVRLEGTNFEEAKAIIENSNLKIIPASNLDEAARKAVEAAN